MSDASVYGPAGRPVFDPAPVRGQRKVFSLAGGLAAGDKTWGWGGVVAPQSDALSTPWYPPGGVALTYMLVAVNVADGTGSYVVDLLVGGSVVATVTLGASTEVAGTDFTIPIEGFVKVVSRVRERQVGIARDMGIIVGYG